MKQKGDKTKRVGLLGVVGEKPVSTATTNTIVATEKRIEEEKDSEKEVQKLEKGSTKRGMLMVGRRSL